MMNKKQTLPMAPMGLISVSPDDRHESITRDSLRCATLVVSLNIALTKVRAELKNVAAI